MVQLTAWPQEDLSLLGLSVLLSADMEPLKRSPKGLSGCEMILRSEGGVACLQALGGTAFSGFTLDFMSTGPLGQP